MNYNLSLSDNLKETTLLLKKVVAEIPERFIWVNIYRQKLFIVSENQIGKEYSISTAKNGVGNKEDSLM